MKKLLSALIISIFSVCCLLPVETAAGLAAEKEVIKDFSVTKVEDDLEAMTIDGKQFSFSDYPKNELASGCSLINLVEYCYSPNVTERANYGLYLYIYNPQVKKILEPSALNKVQMAVGYDENGLPNEWAKFRLEFCGKTAMPYSGLFYKFRVKDAIGDDGKYMVERVNSEARRYDVSGFELLTAGKLVAEEYGVGGTYVYTGYAQGIAGNSESTLAVDSSEKLETVKLDVRHTNYRTGEISKYHQNELNSVYFSVPERLFEEYGKLQKIKAEWYEYKTSPIFVTQDSVAIEDLTPYIGVEIGTAPLFYDKQIKWNVYFGYSAGGAGVNITSAEFGWNLPENIVVPTGGRIPQISWLFSTNGASYKDYIVSRQTMLDYIAAITEKFSNEAKVQGKYWADLFADSIDENRIELLENPLETRGHVVREFDAGETFDLLSYDSTHNGWQRFWKYFGRWGTETGGGAENVSPIVEVNKSDYAAGTAACSTLLINSDDFDDFKKYCDAAYAKTGDAAERVILFRFAQTDFYSAPARFDYTGNLAFSEEDGYMAQETVFLDFDIIQLTFARDQTFTVIPAVSSPIDIINEPTPPLEDTGLGCSNYRSFFKMIGLLSAIFIVWLLINKLIKAVRK